MFNNFSDTTIYFFLCYIKILIKYFLCYDMNMIYLRGKDLSSVICIKFEETLSNLLTYQSEDDLSLNSVYEPSYR